MVGIKEVWKMRKLGTKIKKDLCPSCRQILINYVLKNKGNLGDFNKMLSDMNNYQYQMCARCLDKLNGYALDLEKDKKLEKRFK